MIEMLDLGIQVSEMNENSGKRKDLSVAEVLETFKQIQEAEYLVLNSKVTQPVQDSETVSTSAHQYSFARPLGLVFN